MPSPLSHSIGELFGANGPASFPRPPQKINPTRAFRRIATLPAKLWRQKKPTVER